MFTIETALKQVNVTEKQVKKNTCWVTKTKPWKSWGTVEDITTWFTTANKWFTVYKTKGERWKLKNI